MVAKVATLILYSIVCKYLVSKNIYKKNFLHNIIKMNFVELQELNESMIRKQKERREMEEKKIESTEEKSEMNYSFNTLLDSFIQKKILNDQIMCDMFYSLYPNNFIYDSDNKQWYSINKYGIYRHENNELMTARKLIASEFSEKIERCFLYYIKITTDNDKKEKLIKFFQKTTHYLGTIKLIANMIEMMKKCYAKTKIHDKFDNVNPYVIGFENGVYDLKNRCLRNAKPEELVTKTTGYEYKEGKQDIIEEINELVGNIFLDKELKKYVLQTIALRMIGLNSLEEYYIWIGSGRNGKGLLMKFIDLTFGEYFGTIDIDFFTESHHGVSAGKATPELARNKSSRIVAINEIGDDVKLRTDKLKQISGGDKIDCRMLYGNTFSYIPQYALFFLTNKKPRIDGSDEATAKRIRYIQFKTVFCEDPQEEYERKIDTTIKEKIKDDKYKQAFFQILLKYYFKFVDKYQQKMVIPQSVKNETEEYLNENNPVKEFLKERCEITQNQNDVISSSELYEEFKKSFPESGITTNSFKPLVLKNKSITFKRTRKSLFCGLKFI
jgi:putative DNA primase/helicase